MKTPKNKQTKKKTLENAYVCVYQVHDIIFRQYEWTVQQNIK